MPRTQSPPIARYVRKLLARQVVKDLSDSELLTRYADGGDEAAFATLVERHGPLVWNVCRRMLACEQDAEDAFQAVFLVLARKSKAIRKRGSVASWLYGVAYRIGMKERQRTARRREPLRNRNGTAEPDPAYTAAWHDLQRVLDEELNRLPEKYRSVLVLCCLEGLSKIEAANALGWNEGTVSSRLARGRKLLQARLTARGVTGTAAFLALGLATKSSAASPLLSAGVVRAAVQLISRPAASGTAAGLVSTRVLHMANSALRGVTLASWKLGGSLIVAACMAVTAFALRTPADDFQAPTSSPVARASAGEPKPATRPRTDRHGDPLPARASARLGTVRLRQGWFVLGLAYSPDGKTLALGGAGQGLGLWDAETGKPIKQFDTREQIREIAFSPDGKYLATSRTGGGLWEIATGQRIRQLGDADSFAFSSDGKAIVISDQNSLRFEETLSGKAILKFEGPGDYRSRVALSADGKWVAIGSEDKAVHVWSMATGKEVHCLTGHKNPVQALAASPTGNLLVSGAEDATIRLWDPVGGKELRRLDAGGPVRTLVFSRDGQMFGGSCGEMIRVWDAGTGRVMRSWPRGFGFCKLEFEPTGKTIAVIDAMQSSIHRLDIASGRELGDFGGHCGSVSWLAFAGDGKTLFSTSQDRTARVWDLASGQDQVLFERATQGLLVPVALAPDRKRLATYDRTKSAVVLWDVAAKKQLWLGKSAALRSMVFAPDGKIAVAGGGRADAGPGDLTFWDTTSGRVIGTAKTDSNAAVLAFSPDGRVVASGGHSYGLPAFAEPTLRLWNPATAKPLGNLGHYQSTIALAFSPDGALLASADETHRTPEGRIHLWDLTSQTRRWTAKAQRSTALAFSPDGRVLAAGGGESGSDSSIRLWETASGKEIAKLNGHHSGVWSLAFAPGGRTLASGGGDSQILLWDITPARSPRARAPRADSTRSAKQLWAALAGADAGKAFEAVWSLVLMPEQAVALAKERLRPEPAPDPGHLSELIAGLDSPSFKTRTQAGAALRQLGEPVSPALRAALKQTASLESRRRLEKILEEITALPRRLETIRAIQVLEYIGSRQAREVLEMFAGGLPGTVRTTEAQAVLRRWQKH
jgi:RNA polymerase sigma factor (sigma-70 family)